MQPDHEEQEVAPETASAHSDLWQSGPAGATTGPGYEILKGPEGALAHELAGLARRLGGGPETHQARSTPVVDNASAPEPGSATAPFAPASEVSSRASESRTRQSEARRPPDTRSVNRRSFIAIAGAGVAGAALVGAGIPILRRIQATPTADQRRMRRHRAQIRKSSSSTSSSDAIDTTSFDTSSVGDVQTANLTITLSNGTRTIKTKSMPDHPFDSTYRYAATPTAQNFDFQVTTNPQLASRLTEIITGFLFGVHIDSVIFDPDTANWYDNSFSSGWNENALYLDKYGAHTHPAAMSAQYINDGVYHYHRITSAWVSDINRHSPIVGWASDGFPIYLRYGYSEATNARSALSNLAASYRLKSGSRPNPPGGTYDGTYVADYEYVPGLGDLDACNGRLCVTPDFPKGIYAYFLTDQWPHVPHWIRGTPDISFSPGHGGTIAGGPPGSGTGGASYGGASGGSSNGGSTGGPPSGGPPDGSP